MTIKSSILSKVLITGCSLMIIVSCMIIWKTFEKKNITEIGKTVIVDVIQAPVDCSEITTRTGYCKLRYKGEIFGKRAGNEFCHLVSNSSTVAMLTNEEEDIFLFVGEYDPLQFWYAIIIFLIAIVIGVRGLKRY